MAIYKCDICDYVYVEENEDIKWEDLDDDWVCPDCGAPVQRVIQPVGIIFKGSGFYVTDNRQLPAKEAAKELPGGDGGEAKEKDKTTAGNKE